MMRVIEFSNASRLYGNKRGLHPVELSVNAGEIVGLLGANGSGKTTLLKLAAGLSRPDGGSVRIGGFDVYEDAEKALMGVGALIETPALFVKLSARDNLRVAAKYMNLKNEAMIDRVLEWVGLRDFAKEKVKRFSLGMRQRLALAMAFLGDKKLLLLDEPTNGLDIESALAVKNAVRRAAEEAGTAVVVSSHLSGELETYISRAVILKEGKMIADRGIREILSEKGSLENYYISAGKEALL